MRVQNFDLWSLEFNNEVLRNKDAPSAVPSGKCQVSLLCLPSNNFPALLSLTHLPPSSKHTALFLSPGKTG